MPKSIRFVLILFIFQFLLQGLVAQLSSNATISVITCGSGQELYSTFGHSAFRVQDPSKGLDAIYNYGTFNFNTPNFYLKFARGKLLYSLSRERFEDFLYSYQLENRWVKEQVLALSTPQKNELYRFLETNYEPENRDYQYDFLFNNCSTKIPEVLSKVLQDQIEFGQEHLEDTFTFRQLIQQYLRTNSWSSLGIDIALGAVIDRKAGVLEYMFLPDYVYQQLNHTFLGNDPLVERERTILDTSFREKGGYFTTSPLFWLLLAFLFTATITLIDYRNGSRSKILDFIMFFSTGFVGLFIIFLWFFTDHTSTAWNFNILWACPFNIVPAFYLVKKQIAPRKMIVLVKVLLLMLLIIPLFWLLGIQAFSPLLILVWLSLAIRYLFLFQYYKAPSLPLK